MTIVNLIYYSIKNKLYLGQKLVPLNKRVLNLDNFKV